MLQEVIIIIQTKEVEISWSNNNKEYYKSCGYSFTKIHDKFIVNVEHLLKHNKSEVLVRCDYCFDEGIINIIPKDYCNYLKERRYIEKDCCDKCKYKKYEDVLIYKQQNNLLKINDKGYWKFKENRLEQLKLYIDKYGNIDCMENNKEGQRIYSNIINHNEIPWQLALELGYDINKIMENKPDSWYNDFEVLKNDIANLKNKLGHFPTLQEIKTELNIGYRYIKKHGGMYEIKRKMNINNIEEYIDNSGFYNKSSYELITANYLIANNVRYKREQEPFPKIEGNYRSDFTIYLIDEIIHIEVWGYERNSKSKIGKEYNKTRKIKEKLYDKYNIKYISIEKIIFDKKKYKEILDSLHFIFSYYLNMSLVFVEYDVLIPSSILTDKELLEEAMKYSNSIDYLPSSITLRKNHANIYSEILKRYDNYNNFAETFQKKTLNKENNYWNENKIFELFAYMLNKYGKILNSREMSEVNNDKINKLKYIISSKFGGLISSKLKYFTYCLNNNINIPEIEIDWIYGIAIKIGCAYSKNITDNHMNLAQQILDKYNSINQFNNNLNII